MAGSRSALGCVMALALMNSGCSFIYQRNLGANSEPARMPICTPNSGTIYVDGVVAAWLTGSVIATIRIDGEVDPLLLVPIGYIAVFATSAIVHLGKAKACRRAIDAHNAWAEGNDA